MKARFQIFKAPFYFVGWLAPAYGKDEVNSYGITKDEVNSYGITIDEVNSYVFFNNRISPIIF